MPNATPRAAPCNSAKAGPTTPGYDLPVPEPIGQSLAGPTTHQLRRHRCGRTFHGLCPSIGSIARKVAASPATASPPVAAGCWPLEDGSVNSRCRRGNGGGAEYCRGQRSTASWPHTNGQGNQEVRSWWLVQIGAAPVGGQRPSLPLGHIPEQCGPRPGPAAARYPARAATAQPMGATDASPSVPES